MFLGAGVLGAALSGSGVWYLQGLRSDAAIERLKAEYAGEKATAASTALLDLEGSIKRIADSALASADDITALNTRLTAIRKELKNVKPLPVDCKPDTDRVRHLESAIDATNQTATRRESGKTVPAAYPPGSGRF